MKNLARTLAVTSAIATFGTGAFAQGADPTTMTCADFMGLSADEQMGAMRGNG